MAGLLARQRDRPAAAASGADDLQRQILHGGRDADDHQRASNYVLDTMAAKPALLPAYGYSWPTDLRERDAIVIEYVAGQGASYTAVDATYRNKIMGLVSVWYEARDGMTYEQQTRLNNLEWALRQDGY